MLQTGIASLGDQFARTPAPRYERHRPETTLLYQIVYKHYPDFLAQLAHQAGFRKKDAYTGAVTLIQRFGSALNLNIHSAVHGCTNVVSAGMRRSDHMLFLDGVYVQDGTRSFVSPELT